MKRLTHYIEEVGCVPCDDAKQSIEIKRSALDVLRGKRGRQAQCMDAQCVLRLAKTFPHPIYLTRVTRSRMYAIDKVDRAGKPLHCVRYTRPLADMRDIDAFDKGLGVGTKTITFLAPDKHHALGKKFSNTGGIRPYTKSKGKMPKLARGGKARLLAVGALKP